LLGAMRRELTALDPALTLISPRTIRQRLDESIYKERMVASLSAFFGGLALLLAGIGLYGVMAYSVTQRTAEIGIRMALGANGRDVLWRVLREGIVLIAAGVAIGVPLSVLATRGGASLLFGIRPTDGITIVSTIAILLVAGLVAAYLPARRAASIDPIRAL